MFLYIARQAEFYYDTSTYMSEEAPVELMDTSDCVIEKYTFAEMVEIAKKIEIKGIEADGGFHFFNLMPLYSILDGKIHVKGSVCFFKGRYAFRVFTDYRAGRITIDGVKNRELIELAITSEDIAFKELNIQYAEKVGSLYVVCFRVELKDVSDDLSKGQYNMGAGWFRVKMIFGKEGLIGVYKVDTFSVVVSDYNILDTGVDSAILAKLKLYGDI